MCKNCSPVSNKIIICHSFSNIGKYRSLPVFHSDQIEQIKQRSVKIICPALSYKDGLKELNLSTVITSIVGSSCVKDFMITTLVLQVIFLSHLLPTKYLHSYSFRKAGNILLCKRPSSRFYNSFLSTCVREWDFPWHC